MAVCGLTVVTLQDIETLAENFRECAQKGYGIISLKDDPVWADQMKACYDRALEMQQKTSEVEVVDVKGVTGSFDARKWCQAEVALHFGRDWREEYHPAEPVKELSQLIMRKLCEIHGVGREERQNELLAGAITDHSHATFTSYQFVGGDGKLGFPKHQGLSTISLVAAQPPASVMVETEAGTINVTPPEGDLTVLIGRAFAHAVRMDDLAPITYFGNVSEGETGHAFGYYPCPAVNDYKLFQLNEAGEIIDGNQSTREAQELQYFEDTPLQHLPPELWKNICSFLHPDDAISLSQVCRALHTASGSTLNKAVMGVLGTGEALKDSLKACVVTYREFSRLEKRFNTLRKDPCFLDRNPGFPETFSDARQMITSLDLEGRHNIEDISFLSTLTNLSSLNLAKCWQIEDFSPLFSLINLSSLNLGECWQFEDFSSLSSLTNLSSLNLRGCDQIEDTSSLSSLTNLSSLNLRSCTQIQDISFLANLQNLSSLDLEYCEQIQDISFLTNLQNLSSLNLEFCHRIEDISSLSSLTHLSSLDLKGSPANQRHFLSPFPY